MLTYLCMSLVLVFLGYLILYKAKLLEVNNSFFDKDSTVAMRGFWCIIIILVHVPELYHNIIQDMLGSFAYVGVTFFFMASAYGLKYGINKNSGNLNFFWRRRLLKLLIPLVLVSIVEISVCIYCGIRNPRSIFRFCEWVCWLLVCYLFFWIVYKNKGIKHKDGVVSLLVVLFSLFMYFVGNYHLSVTWTTEIYGFIWGLMLAGHRDEFMKKALDKWWIRSAALCVLSLSTGIIYLSCKHVFFAGEYLIKIALGCLILLFILQLTTRIRIGNPAILFLGGMSYEMFLAHDAVMKLLAKTLPELDSGIFIVLTIICTILLSAVVNMISNRLIMFVKQKGEIKNGREET